MPNMSNPIEELMSVVTDEQVKEDKSYSWKPQTVEQCVKRKDLWKIPRKGGHVSKYWDYVTGGAIKGEVHMLVAPSGGGKTRTGIEVACNLLDEGWKVCYLTFEQTKEEIYEMVLLHYADGDYTMAKSDMTWELIKDKVFAVREFENDDKDRVIDMLNHLGNYDALILDYVAPPDNCPLGGPEMSTTMRLMCKGIKDAATKNNQYVFCMAQGRDAQPPKGIDGDVPFSDVSDIWCSAQMITPLNVVCIQKSSRFDANEKFLDFVKVRKPLNGVSKCRIVRKYDFAALKSEDTQLRDICGGVINGDQGVQTSADNEAAE